MANMIEVLMPLYAMGDRGLVSLPRVALLALEPTLLRCSAVGIGLRIAEVAVSFTDRSLDLTR